MMVVHQYSPDKSRDTLFISIATTTKSRIRSARWRQLAHRFRQPRLRDACGSIRTDCDRQCRHDVVVALQGQNGSRLRACSASADGIPGAFRFQRAAARHHKYGGSATSSSGLRRRRSGKDSYVKLAAQDYSTNSYLDRDPAIAIGIFQRPGSNALSTSTNIKKTMNELAKRFPPGLKYDIVYNPTEFIQQSVEAVESTIGEAIILVVLVVILFLQTWRAAIIPIVAIPISLIGTFFFMAVFGFTLNNLAVWTRARRSASWSTMRSWSSRTQRNIENGLTPHDAAVKAWTEVGGALIAIALVLSAVFIPSAFITGIAGQFYRQFALTIAGATIISLIVSLTLSPALCAMLLKPHHEVLDGHWWSKPIHGFFGLFNRYFDMLTRGYGKLSAKLVRIAVMMLVVYAGIIAFGLNEFRKTPVGFIPQLDRGYLIIVTQLPPAASLARTDGQPQGCRDRAVDSGLRMQSSIVGFSGATLQTRPTRVPFS
jgi:multidrug efflux pump subunit AcrB